MGNSNEKQGISDCHGYEQEGSNYWNPDLRAGKQCPPITKRICDEVGGEWIYADQRCTGKRKYYYWRDGDEVDHKLTEMMPDKYWDTSESDSSSRMMRREELWEGPGVAEKELEDLCTY